MKVLLVNTNRMKPPIAPLALDYLGSALGAAGHAADLLDLCLAPDAAPPGDAYDLVALSFRNTDDCYCASRQSFADVLCGDVAAVKQWHDGPIVVGGGGFAVMPTHLLEACGATFGAVGDGEAAITALLDALADGRDPGQVRGLVHRQDGAWVVNAPARFDLAATSLAARNTVDNPTYFARGGQVGIETKRGCGGQCIYCADPVIKGHDFRPRPPADVVREFGNLADRGIDWFHLCDSEFNLPPQHAAAVCEGLVTAGLGARIHWHTYACPVPFTAELAGLMQRAGCVGVNFGVDSGSDRMLRALRRSHTSRDIAAAAGICRRLGLTCMFDLLLGAPGETPETVRESLTLMKSLDPDRVGISLGVRLYPGTPLHGALAPAGNGTPGLIGQFGGLEPVFYTAPELGPDPAARVREIVGDDPRFLVPVGEDEQDYNYNDNQVLQDAIDRGYRGAYWDILRKLAAGIGP